MWDEMKENARKASTPAATANAANTPGGTFIANRLAKYIADNRRNVDVHLVGHSAGAIFHSYLLERLAAFGVAVKTMALLAPAVRVDLFAAKVLPRLGAGRSGARLALFNLTNKRELDDSTALYRKSLLYLVSRALEPLPAGKSEAPILGMEKHLDTSVPGGSLRTLLTTAGAKIVIAPDLDQGDGYASNSQDHGGFDDDALTMTTVARHVLGAEPVPFVAGMPLDPAVAPPMAVGEARVPLRAAFALPAGPAATRDGDLPLESATPERVRVEVAQAPITGSPGMDVLVYGEGWTKRDAEPVTSSPRVAKARPRKR
jgi:hypothetical protein